MKTKQAPSFGYASGDAREAVERDLNGAIAIVTVVTRESNRTTRR